jgi:RNA polymerase sigma-70 factor, ECF subfamily
MPDGAGPAGAPVTDGDLVRLARAGDEVAFRLLVERHQAMVRARARSLSPNPSDVDDIVQESLLRAFVALDRLRDPDRFAGWLGGIAANVCRSVARSTPLTLVPDWPEQLHPASADGVPSADDLDRADALRAAVAGLPAGQQRAVALHYYADRPAGDIAEQAGAARVSLHKARQRLRAYITEHRPDLVPAVSGRPPMTAVHIARTERRDPPGWPPQRRPSHVVVLADDAGHRELPLWLLPFDGHRLAGLLNRVTGTPSKPPGEAGGDTGAGSGPPGPAVPPMAQTVDELIEQLLHVAGVRVAGVDIGQPGPDITAARVQLAGPAGTRHVTARLAEGLALAIRTGARVRVADAVMDRLAVPSQPGPGAASSPGAGESPAPGHVRRPGAAPGRRRSRYEPRNLSFADGLDWWVFGGSFAEHAAQSHWHDYVAETDHEIAVLRSVVPEPEGFAVLAQQIFADDYRDAVVTFRGEFRSSGGPGRASLGLRVSGGRPVPGLLTEESVLADPNNHVVAVPASRDWTRHEVTARVPEDSDVIVFAIFLAGPGHVELRNPALARA